MAKYVLPLTTLDNILSQSRLIDTTAVDSTVSDNHATVAKLDTFTRNYLKNLLFDISDEMQQHFNRRLTPYYEAKEFYSDYIGQHFWYNRNRGYQQLDLDKADGDDSLSISSLDWNGTTLTASDYRYIHPNQTPNRAIVFNQNTALTALDSFSEKVTITGIWGYHDNVATMWKDSGDTVQNSTQISATGTSLIVSDTTNFETYQLICIKDEYCLITNVTKGSNTLTIERAKNGTTGAIHASGTQIDTFVPMPTVAKECRRLVLRSWHLKDDPRGNIFITEQAIREISEGGIKDIIPHKWTIGSV